MLSGTHLVHGSSIRKRLGKINEIIRKLDQNLLKEGHPDVLIIKKDRGKNKISINRSREIISFLSVKPYNSPYKVALVESAEYMSSQAQNALLKTLEEPPDYAVIILSTKKEQSLLPTIISRCKLHTVRDEDFYLELSDKDPLKEILSGDVGHKLGTAQEIAGREREDVIELLEHWIMEERLEMVENNRFHKVNNVETLLMFLHDIEETNVNPRLALETLFFKLK